MELCHTNSRLGWFCLLASSLAFAEGNVLSFSIQNGDIQSRFYREGPIAAHALASSGLHPRFVVAFPAGNSGIGLWFEDQASPVTVELEGELKGYTDGALHGVEGTLRSSAASLKIKQAVLGSVRSLREYAAQKTVPSEIAFEIDPGPPFRYHRTLIGGNHHLQLSLVPEGGATIDAEGGAPVLKGPEGNPGFSFHFVAATDETPLTPLPPGSLISKPTVGASTGPSREELALAYLTYQEKLLAGSWTFLTYFGRDTLLSVRLLMPALSAKAVEAGLSSVLERLSPKGEVAHEEDIGDWAALRHLSDPVRPANLRSPIYDYKMIDGDFLLAPVAASYLLDRPEGQANRKAFLARKSEAGVSYAELLKRNLDHVLEAAKPFAADPKPSSMVSIKPGVSVGNWRDSQEGLGGGKVPYDVNRALVPAALDAAARFFATEPLKDPQKARLARKLKAGWGKGMEVFHVTISKAEAVTRVKAYAAELGIDSKPALDSIRGPISFSALSLDEQGRPIPVMNSDDGFLLLFGEPTNEELAQTAQRLLQPFPAGLITPAGVVVANAAFSTDPAQRKLFSQDHYHGAVVWSWQQALYAAGLRRQLGRADLPSKVKDVLKQAERALWDAIDATSATRTAELWSWEVKDGKIQPVPFGQRTGHLSESNPVQLWSTVFLGLTHP